MTVDDLINQQAEINCTGTEIKPEKIEAEVVIDPTFSILHQTGKVNLGRIKIESF